MERLSPLGRLICEGGVGLAESAFNEKNAHARWQAFLKQAERDDNVLTLLSVVRDAFDFAQLEDVLKSIEAGSTQAEILTRMLVEVKACGEFIKLYADNPQLCTLTSPPCRRL